jgi:type VI secretion system protein ImpL
MEFSRQLLMNQAACYIQSLWEGEVLGPARGFEHLRQDDLFADPGGLVWKFVDKNLKYILHRPSADGYEPKKLLDGSGSSIPFTREFLVFFNSGMSKYKPAPARDKHDVTIETLAAYANDGTPIQAQPTSVELWLQCVEREKQTLKYSQYTERPVTFIWRQGSCGDTGLTIHFKDGLRLNKLYEGENGFPEFLRDFQSGSGSKTFKAEDFPKDKNSLYSLGVSAITVKYKIAGTEGLSGSHGLIPGKLPPRIAKCEQ